MAPQPTLNTMTAIQLPDGKRAALTDWSHRPRWSTCDILTGATDERIELFTYNVGDPVVSTNNIGQKRQATEEDTNVAINNAMASTEEMYVYSMHVEYIALATDPLDPTNANTATEREVFNPLPIANRLAALQRKLRLEIEDSMKVVFECPLSWLNAGFGVFAAAGQQAATGPGIGHGTIGNPGLPSNEAVRRFAIPVHIGGQEKHIVRLRNPTAQPINIGLTDFIDPAQLPSANTLYSVRVLMDGLHKLPVA